MDFKLPDPPLRPISEDARRLHALKVMCGFVENGSNCYVGISQDDASREWTVSIDHRVVGYGDSFYAAIDKAIEAMTVRENLE